MWLSDLEMAVTDLTKCVGNCCCLESVKPRQTMGCGAEIVFVTTAGKTYVWRERTRDIYFVSDEE